MYKIFELLLLCALLSIMVPASLATIGNEYVHITVHVPKEVSAEYAFEHSATVLDEDYQVPHEHFVPHRVIHHYHHRKRRPARKPQHNKHSYKHVEHDALLDSLVSSDWEVPTSSAHLEYLQHADDIAKHLVKPKTYEAPKKIVNKYTVIEERVPAGYADADAETNLYSHSHGYSLSDYYNQHKNKYKAPHQKPEVDALKTIGSKLRYVQRPSHSAELISLRPVGDDDGAVGFVDSYRKTLPTSFITTSYHAPKDSYTPPRDTLAPLKKGYLPPVDSYLPQRESLMLPNRPAQDFRASGYTSDVDVSIGDSEDNGSLSDAYDYSHRVVETYSGIDSYRAAHVQGVDNPGYMHRLSHYST